MQDPIAAYASRLQLERAALLDRELYKMLKRHGIPFNESIEKLRETLREMRFEMIMEERETPTATIHTFKLCRLFDTHTITIPKPVL